MKQSVGSPSINVFEGISIQIQNCYTAEVETLQKYW